MHKFLFPLTQLPVLTLPFNVATFLVFLAAMRVSRFDVGGSCACPQEFSCAYGSRHLQLPFVGALVNSPRDSARIVVQWDIQEAAKAVFRGVGQVYLCGRFDSGVVIWLALVSSGSFLGKRSLSRLSCVHVHASLCCMNVALIFLMNTVVFAN